MVYGGSSDKSEMKKEGWKYTWNIKFAYIMKGPEDMFKGSYDIGITRISILAAPLFNKNDLNDKVKLFHAKIVPICLSANGFNFDKLTIRGVGWGRQYDESPENEKSVRNPRYSSCMTNQVGKEKWKYKGCDLDFIKVNQWNCEKVDFPPDYPRERHALCKKHFVDLAKSLNVDDKKKLESVDKIYITDQNDKTDVCYQPKYFSQIGWCNVQGHYKDPEAWGFCSPSCNQNIMKVGLINLI